MDNRKIGRDLETLIKKILPVDTPDFSLEDVERMFNEEIKKPVDEMDFDLVYECIQTIDFRMINKSRRFSVGFLHVL